MNYGPAVILSLLNNVYFVASIWTGWVLTLCAAELWIRYTRPRTQRVAVAAAAA